MNNPVILFGAGLLGRQSKEIFEQNNVVVYGFLDENKKLINTLVDDVTVLGDLEDEAFNQLIGKKCDAFVALDDNPLKRNIVEKLWKDRHVKPVNAIHKTVVLSRKVTLGHGNFIDSHTSVNIGTHIGNNCIINAQSTIGAETQIADFVQIGAGSTLGHGVTVGEEAFLGTGVVVTSGVTIGARCRVGAGSVVITAVKEDETVLGNPAKKVNAQDIASMVQPRQRVK